jgi:phosphomannomutase
VRDYLAGERTAADGTRAPLSLPKSNVLTFELSGGNRIIARPSGTEPKIKFYFDLRAPLEEGEDYAAAKARATKSMEALMEAFTAATAEAR